MAAPSSSLTSHHDPFRRNAGSSERVSAESMVYELLGTSLIHPEDWQRLNSLERERVLRANDKAKALSMLVDQGLLTQYQAARISAGTTFGLVLGNYRVVDRIGAGGMAVVFKA